jgi:hypothetical protein
MGDVVLVVRWTVIVCALLAAVVLIGLVVLLERRARWERRHNFYERWVDRGVEILRLRNLDPDLTIRDVREIAQFQIAREIWMEQHPDQEWDWDNLPRGFREEQPPAEKKDG